MTNKPPISGESKDGTAIPQASGELRVSAEDRVLIARILAGDEEAFVTLVGRLHSSLMRQSVALLGDVTAAEDVVQETWIAVLEGLSRFEGRAALRTWITRILMNRIRTRRSKDRRFVSLVEQSGGDDPAVDPDSFDRRGQWRVPVTRWPEESPERLTLSEEIRTVIESALEQLPASQRSVVLLRDVEGFTASEACEALELSEINQRVLLHRGRSRLRRVLDGYKRTGERPQKRDS